MLKFVGLTCHPSYKNRSMLLFVCSENSRKKGKKTLDIHQVEITHAPLSFLVQKICAKTKPLAIHQVDHICTISCYQNRHQVDHIHTISYYQNQHQLDHIHTVSNYQNRHQLDHIHTISCHQNRQTKQGIWKKPPYQKEYCWFQRRFRTHINSTPLQLLGISSKSWISHPSTKTPGLLCFNCEGSQCVPDSNKEEICNQPARVLIPWLLRPACSSMLYQM